MRQQHSGRIPIRDRFIATGSICLLVIGGAVAQAPNGMNTFDLRPGVVVDSARKRLYVMNPEGGIEAIDLAKGERVWNTKAAAKPLGITGDRLISQAEATGQAPALTVVALNPDNGQQVVTGTMPLPAGVRPTTTETPKSNFVAQAKPAAGAEAVVSWTYSERPRRGIPPVPKDAVAPGEAAPAAATAKASATTVRSGSFVLDLQSGATAPAAAPPVAPPLTAQALPVAPENRVPNAAENQFFSADGRHVLASRVTGEDTEWDRYTLTIYDRATNNRVGEFKSHVALIPFFVDGSRVIFATAPYTRRTEQGVMEEPPKIRAVDLESGKEVWNKEIRETTYRGPFPP